MRSVRTGWCSAYFDGSAYFRAIGIDDFFLGDGASLEGGEVSGEEMGLRLSETGK